MGRSVEGPMQRPLACRKHVMLQIVTPDKVCGDDCVARTSTEVTEAEGETLEAEGWLLFSTPFTRSRGASIKLGFWEAWLQKLSSGLCLTMLYLLPPLHVSEHC